MRPGIGGRAREIGSSEKAGFNLSTETTFVLSPSWRGKNYVAVPGPNKDPSRVELEEEQKHPFPWTQIWQLTGLAEEVQAEQEKYDEAE